MQLTDFFKQNPRAAIAFSGGVDSAYLICAARNAGADVTAYLVCSAFQPQFEWEDAERLAAQLGIRLRILSADVLEDPRIAANPQNRCYFCKRRLFAVILTAASQDGYSLVLDGTNASDDVSDRPGFLALQELGVRSPLRECGLTKTEIRRLSREAGLFTWDKPAYACLATRIPAGEPITAEKLQITERAEVFLRSLGFRDFRVRMRGRTAMLQLREEDLPLLLQCRETILSTLRRDYDGVTLDLEVRT